jgi:hydroxyethylthiazole kinase-like uncharacterized protein yjeF
MKILSAEQVREADAYTMLHEPISSIDLMERAAQAFTDRLLSLSFVGLRTSFDMYCGPGNNGGDGLAIARLLSEKGYKCRVFILPALRYSSDYLTNLKRLRELSNSNVDLLEGTGGAALPPCTAGGVIIDALYGSGLNKPIDGLAAQWVAHINRQKCYVIAVDIPSGLPANEGPAANASVIQASHTLTFQQPKFSMLLAEHALFVGLFDVLDIGLSKSFINSLPSAFTYITAELAGSLLRSKPKFSHKGTYGHALLVAGSYGRIGAAVLAAQACLRSGAGLLTVQAPGCGYDILQTSVPEAMVIPDSPQQHISGTVPLDPYSVVGIGPGIGLEKETQNTLKLLIQQCASPMVIDADALNILAENRTWISFIPPGSILTPHPKEFERLIGKKGNSSARLEWQREFALKHRVYLVLKGAHTSIASPEGELFFNSSGNPGMAKGGSGDVLTGLLTGLLAQGYLPENAALLGVYLHGLAGDFAAETHSMDAMTAGDITQAFGEAFLVLRQFGEPFRKI